MSHLKKSKQTNFRVKGKQTVSSLCGISVTICSFNLFVKVVIPPPSLLTNMHYSYFVSCLPVSGNEDCLWYVDKNGTWHNGFDCPLITFCCGNCHRRYCCLDAFKMITEREQKRCMLFQFRWGRRLQLRGSQPVTLLLIHSTPGPCDSLRFRI